jgi:hypothetical protein
MSWLFCQDGRIVRFALPLLLALLVVAPAAQAQGLVGHSVTYDVKPLKEDKAVYLEGQASSTLSRSCKEWSLGEIFQLAVERAKASGKVSLDGSTLKYQVRLRHDARVDTATGTATLGKEPGKLHAVLSRYKQDSALPAGTLGPAAARAALVEALVANKPGKIEIDTIEMFRFHKPVKQIFTRLAPEDSSIARGMPKDLKAPSKEFAAGKMWALKRQVPEFNEFGDELWLLHESGAILREVVQRQKIALLLEAREVSIFPPPSCP